MLKRFIRDLLTYMPSRVLPGLTAFITTPLLTRLFPPAEYGYWALASSTSSFLVALSISGFGSAVLRYYQIYKTKATLNVFFATLGVSIVAAIMVVTGIGFLSLLFLKEYLPPALGQLLPLIFLIFVAQSIFTVFITILRSQGRSGSFTFFQLFMIYGGLGLGLLLVVIFGWRVDGLLWGSFIALAVALPFLIFQATKGVGVHPRHFHNTDALQLWQYAWPLTLGNVAMWGLRVSDLYIINLFRPEKEVGLYSVSYNISAKSIELLVALFLLSVTPLVYGTWENEGREAAEKVLTMVTRVYFILCLPAAFGLTVLAQPFVALLASPDYYEGSKIVGYVALSTFIWGLTDIAVTGLLIKKKASQLGVNQVVAALTHIGLQFLLVPRFGYVASAISTLIGYTLLLVLNAIGSRPHLAWRLPVSSLRNVIAASVVMGLVARWVYGIYGYDSKPSLTYLFLSVAVAVVIYFGSLWFLGEASVEEKDKVLQLIRNVIGKGAPSNDERRG
jgi:O-antigen/teichoic acid export membrane protein